MKRVTLFVALIAVLALVSLSSVPAALAERNTEMKEAPADRVVVMYFHRTKRCPTCQKMGSYSEEAVTKGFPQEVKDGSVEFHYVDFQDKKNAALKKGYKVDGPALIVAKVAKNKVAQFSNLKDIWAKHGDKEAFLKYIRDDVKAKQKSAG